MSAGGRGLGYPLAFSADWFIAQPIFKPNRLEVRSLAKKTERWILEHHAPVTALSLSVDGHELATADQAGEVIVWNLKTGEKRAQSKPLGRPISGLAFSSELETLFGVVGRELVGWSVTPQGQSL